MSCVCDNDPCDIWDEKERKARKEYRCYECGEKIEKGDTYIHISALHYGEWSHFRVCEFCKHDWGVVTDAGHCYEIGGLSEAWQEMWGQ